MKSDSNRPEAKDANLPDKLDSADSDQAGLASRRSFNRKAAAGGVVLASLGSRTAWGGHWATDYGPCMSTTVWNSFAGNNHTWASFRPVNSHDNTTAQAIVNAHHDGDWKTNSGIHPSDGTQYCKTTKRYVN